MTHAKPLAGPGSTFSVQSCSVSFLCFGHPEGHVPLGTGTRRVSQGFSKSSRPCLLSLCELASTGPSRLRGTDRNTLLDADTTPRQVIPIGAKARMVQDQQQQSEGAAPRAGAEARQARVSLTFRTGHEPQASEARYAGFSHANRQLSEASCVPSDSVQS